MKPYPTGVDGTSYRSTLAHQIFLILQANGKNARGVYDGLKAVDIPRGGINELIQIRPFDAVRAEVAGATVTVEISTERQGERPEADSVYFACYDLETFQSWFFRRLQQNGIEPVRSVSVHPARSSAGIRPDLRAAPFLTHRKQKGGRR